jgi:hypothetical protein
VVNTGHAPAAFLILIGDSGALGVQGSTNRVVVVVAGSREDYPTQAGGHHGVTSGAVAVVHGRTVVAAVTIVVVDVKA